jgi:hypothetical protein
MHYSVPILSPLSLLLLINSFGIRIAEREERDVPPILISRTDNIKFPLYYIKEMLVYWNHLYGFILHQTKIRVYAVYSNSNLH